MIYVLSSHFQGFVVWALAPEHIISSLIECSKLSHWLRNSSRKILLMFILKTPNIAVLVVNIWCCEISELELTPVLQKRQLEETQKLQSS